MEIELPFGLEMKPLRVVVKANGRCYESDEFEIHIVILYEIFESLCTFLRSIKSSIVLSRNVIVALFPPKRITYLLL